MSGKRRYKFVNMGKYAYKKEVINNGLILIFLPRATYGGRWGHINIKREKYE